MKKRRDIRIALCFIFPAFLSILVFTIAPIIYTVFISFTNYNMYHLDNYDMVGVANYISVITGSISDIFFPVLGWTIVFALLCTA